MPEATIENGLKRNKMLYLLFYISIPVPGENDSPKMCVCGTSPEIFSEHVSHLCLQISSRQTLIKFNKMEDFQTQRDEGHTDIKGK